jgi:ferredoxin
VARLHPGEQRFEAPADVPLLLAAQHAGITMASSCRNGTCRACLRQLVSGSITYRIEWPGVSADEKRNGLILPCVACAASDVVLAPPDDAL